jgi:hypothetical protein
MGWTWCRDCTDGIQPRDRSSRRKRKKVQERKALRMEKNLQGTNKTDN